MWHRESKYLFSVPKLVDVILSILTLNKNFYMYTLLFIMKIYEHFQWVGL